MFTCTLSARYVDHVAWVGSGDGWGDVHVRVNMCSLARFLHTTLIMLLGLGLGMGGVILNVVLTCTLSAHYVSRSRCLGWVCGWVG